jgi:hypothetical protein
VSRILSFPGGNEGLSGRDGGGAAPTAIRSRTRDPAPARRVPWLSRAVLCPPPPRTPTFPREICVAGGLRSSGGHRAPGSPRGEREWGSIGGCRASGAHAWGRAAASPPGGARASLPASRPRAPAPGASRSSRALGRGPALEAAPLESPESSLSFPSQCHGAHYLTSSGSCHQMEGPHPVVCD